MLKVAQLVEFWLVTPEVAGSGPVLQPNYCRFAKLVRQRTLTPLFGGSNPSSATNFCGYDVTVAYDLAKVDVRVRLPVAAYYLDVGEFGRPTSLRGWF